MVRHLFRLIGLLLDSVVVVLFLVGYLARYLHPRYAWWAELVATGLPYVSLALVGAALVTLVARRWVLFGLHLVLVVLAVGRFVSWEGGASPEPDDLTVLTFNTSRGVGARVEQQERAITALIRAETPDLVGFQEAFIEYHPNGHAVRPEAKLAPLVDTLGYRSMRTDLEGAIYTSHPVLGRVELIEQTQIPLDEGTAKKGKSHVVRTHFRWKGREAVHYNLHLRSFGNDKPWEDQRRDPFSIGFWRIYLRQYRDAYLVRASEVEKIRDLMREETLPLIVSGDFNSTPHNSAFYRLSDGLQDAFKVAGQGWGATYRADLPLARIDHVLVSPEWKVVHAHVSKVPYSDHLPLVVRLRWRE